MHYSIKSLYLCVDDMDRAVHFYEELFNMKVTSKDNVYSVFDVGGFRLGLFAYQLMDEPHSYGTNCLPSIEIDSLKLLNEKLAAYKVVFPLTKIGRNWVAEIEDSEGNHLELTTPVVE